MGSCIHHWHIELIAGKEIGVCQKCKEEKVFRQVLFHAASPMVGEHNLDSLRINTRDRRHWPMVCIFRD